MKALAGVVHWLGAVVAVGELNPVSSAKATPGLISGSIPRARAAASTNLKALRAQDVQ